MSADSETNTFYNELLDRQSREPEVDLPAIANAWLLPTRASWVWIWLRNSAGPTAQWELVASAAAKGEAPAPPTPTFAANDCLGDWCLTTKSPVLAGKPDTELHHNGISFRPQFRDWLVSQGHVLFDLIPLISTPFLDVAEVNQPALPVGVAGMVALHYCSAETRTQRSAPEFARMAQVTVHAILRSFREKQLALLVTLNKLEAKYLPRFGKPRSARQEYVHEAIKVMTQSLHSNAVSIFYRRSASKSIYCVGSTGLYDPSTAKKVPSELLETVEYDPDHPSRTATCLRTSKTFVRLAGTSDPTHRGQYAEMPEETPLIGLALIMVPIPDYRETDSSTRGACGVIRVSGHTSALYPGKDKNYDALEIQLVEFIAAQISPVLATFSHSIAREDAITVLKHDLLAPLNMIRDGLNDAERAQYERPGASMPEYQLKHYGLRNMQYAQLFAQNLALQLDVDPYEIKSLVPESTSLEGDIIARLKNLMGHFAAVENDMSIRFSGFRGDETQPPVPRLLVDKVLTERVFTNLLSNAIKYGKEGSTVHISAKIARKGLHVYVTNEGFGIADSEAPYIFEPYYRGEAAKRAHTGAGLGLGIARNAMRAMGGNIFLHSRREPTTFDVFFPQELFLRP